MLTTKKYCAPRPTEHRNLAMGPKYFHTFRAAQTSAILRFVTFSIIVRYYRFHFLHIQYFWVSSIRPQFVLSLSFGCGAGDYQFSLGKPVDSYRDNGVLMWIIFCITQQLLDILCNLSSVDLLLFCHELEQSEHISCTV